MSCFGQPRVGLPCCIVSNLTQTVQGLIIEAIRSCTVFVSLLSLINSSTTQNSRRRLYHRGTTRARTGNLFE